jgi:hypothetical protein
LIPTTARRQHADPRSRATGVIGQYERVKISCADPAEKAARR